MAPFDSESTAPNPEVARLVTATVAEVRPGADTRIVEHLVAVEEDIPAEATEIHGITTEQARANGKPLPEVAEVVAAHLTELMAAGVPVVGMNLSYDVTLLQRELWRCGLPSLEDRGLRHIAPLIDVFVIDKAVDRYRKGGRKLTDLCAFYGVKLDGAHDATFDALGAARVAYKMCKRAEMAVHDPRAVMGLYGDRPRQAEHITRAFAQLGRMSLDQLHQAQAGWYAEQSTSLGQYFRQKANELEYQAERSEDDAERETFLADAGRLRDQADGMSSDWPLRPLAVAS
jgi:DNA polymerase-3 subunit epsilon